MCRLDYGNFNNFHLATASTTMLMRELSRKHHYPPPAAPASHKNRKRCGLGERARQRGNKLASSLNEATLGKLEKARITGFSAYGSHKVLQKATPASQSQLNAFFWSKIPIKKLFLSKVPTYDYLLSFLTFTTFGALTFLIWTS